MLDPLAEVGIGVLMAIIRVGRRQFMVDVLRHSKRRQYQEDTDNPQGHSRTEHGDTEAELHG